MKGKVEQPRWAFAKLQGKGSCWIFCNLAHGYIQAALAALGALEDPSGHGGIYSLLPILFGLQQGIEVFLKGATLFNNTTPETTHDLPDLVSAYNECIPSTERRFDTEVVDRIWWLDDTCRQKLNQYASGTAARYLHDKKGKLLVPGLTINETALLRSAKACQEECVRIHILMIKASQPKPETWLVNPLNTWWEPDHMYRERCEEALKEVRETKRKDKGRL